MTVWHTPESAECSPVPPPRRGRWGVTVAAGVCLLATLGGCQPADKPAPLGASKAAITVKPQRIVSLNLCADQLLLQLVEPQRIAALSKLAHDPELSMLETKARTLPIVRGDTEEVLLLKPDLVLVGAYTTRYTSQMLRDLGIRVVEVPLAHKLDEVVTQTELVAAAVGEPERGQKLVQTIREQEQALRTTVQGDPKPWPIAAERSWQGYSTGKGTMMDELLQLAGYRNAGVMAGLNGYGYLPLERLVEAQPDLMMTPDYARKLPSVEPREQLHPALAGTSLSETILPTRMTICGGYWSLQVARMLAQRKSAS